MYFKGGQMGEELRDVILLQVEVILDGLLFKLYNSPHTSTQSPLSC